MTAVPDSGLMSTRPSPLHPAQRTSMMRAATSLMGHGTKSLRLWHVLLDIPSHHGRLPANNPSSRKE
jgi:hypothetical protein